MAGEKYMTKIMVVDDDKKTTDLVKEILTFHGFEAIAVNDSTTVIETANLIFPDIFLLDLMMPGIDGFKLCTMLRADRAFSTTPIIIVTALNDIDSKAVAFGAGADDYITKPYLPTDLLKKIEAFFEKDEDA
jgi:DNA-binding response OmpR family regulator